MDKFYDCVPCDDFNDFISKVHRLRCDQGHSRAFRGHRKTCWDLRTSLERECLHFSISGDEAFRREYNMVREFRRRLHYYQTSVPNRDDVDEWMALMQHYGAPTRLLDFNLLRQFTLIKAFPCPIPLLTGALTISRVRL